VGSTSTPVDTDTGTPVTGSRCTLSGGHLSCTHEVGVIPASQTGDEDRRVYWQVPLGTPPAEGWPTVLLFQGTALPAARFWDAHEDDLFGLFHQVATTRALLDAGFAVISPDARSGGLGFWDTNVLPWSLEWEGAPDHRLMLALFEGIDAGQFGALRSERLLAGGFSSGGYMTSRMAVSYPGRFDALAIVAGSYAWCGGVLCTLPDTLPAGHPPTLFLHGAIDWIVPMWTMDLYHDQLLSEGYTTRRVTEAGAGHVWIDAAPTEIEALFDTWGR